MHFQNSLTGIKSIIEEFKPSIMVLDVEVGKENGIDHAKDILAAYPALPILFISSHTDIEHIARGVRAGGLGYLRKPFETEELIVYIERFAQTEKPGEQMAQVGSYRLNLATRELLQKGEVLKQLSPHEFKCLLLLLENPNSIVSHETLANGIWGNKYDGTDASLNSLIYRLRKILKNNRRVSIENVKNGGYRISLVGGNP